MANKKKIRNQLSIRKATHVSQQTLREPGFEEKVLTIYLTRLNIFLSPFKQESVLQWYETPVYFDMLGASIIDFFGSNTVDMFTIGYDKKRFTILLTISGNGFVANAWFLKNLFSTLLKSLWRDLPCHEDLLPLLNLWM